jgi:RHS repeat-associated protein
MNSKKANRVEVLRAVSAALAGACVVLAAMPVDAASITRSSAFEYDANGVLIKEVVEPDSSALCVVNDYVIDGFGNRKSATTRNCNGSTVNEAAAPAAGSAALFASRTTKTGYSSDGRFAISVTNALGQTETRTFNPTLGVMTSLTGPNGLTTSWAYDGLGRKVLERRADTNGTRWAYEYCAPFNGSTLSCPTVAAGVSGSVAVSPAYVVTTTPVSSAVVNLTVVSAADGLSTSADGGNGAANGPYTKVYYDTLGRVIRTETQGPDIPGPAPTVYQDTSYDSLGRVLAKSRPYAAGASVKYWSTLAYDKLNRVISATTPDENKAAGSTTTTSYQGLTTVVTNDKGQTLTETRNVAGQVVTIKDTNDQILSKTWDAYGNLLKTTDALGNEVTLAYDTKGRKTGMKDPDMGSWTYVYDALGQLTSQTDAKAQTTMMSYDVGGRMTQKSEPSLTSNWYYDAYKDASACAKGVGKLCEVSSTNGFGRKVTYDGLGRASSTTSTIGSTYTATNTYDGNGRVAWLIYPSGVLSVKNVYTDLGYLKQVVDGSNPNNVYWKADAMDAEGHLTKQTTGNLISTVYSYYPESGRLKAIQAGSNGSTTYHVQNASYSYDTIGNLSSASDSAVGATQTYGYDALNRLTSETRLGTSVTTATVITWDYNEIGNIRSRSDVGTYKYPLSGASAVRPHAVTGITNENGLPGVVNGLSSPTYAYDANGNLTSATGRTVTWTSFNKVDTITQSAVGNVLNYLYDADGERVKETYSKNGTLQRTTIYLNPGAGAGLYYEEETTPSGGIKQKHYLSAAGGTFALLIYNKATSTWTTQYWHKDNLGSTVAVSDTVGGVKESDRMAYEPFGKRRNVNQTTDFLAILAPTTTRRGFTGHEMIDEVGLVNMNGRVFDPAISRFLSADPHIEAPGNLQSYNRYSYVMNSPLNATDPTGYWSLAKFIKAAVTYTLIPTPKNLFNLVLAAPGNPQLKGIAIAAGCSFATAGAGTAGCVAIGQAVLAKSYGAKDWQALKAGAIAGATAYAMYRVGDAFAGAGDKATNLSKFENALGHAAVGCGSAVASGGQCGSGAAGGFAGALGSNFGAAFGGNTLPGSMVVGGLASMAAGGKFGDGAKTAAYGYLFNACGHDPNGCFKIGVGLGTATGVGLAAGCDLGTAGACIAANPLIVASSTGVGATLGALADRIGNALDSVFRSEPEYVTPDPEQGDPERFRRGPNGTRIDNEDGSVWDKNKGNGHGGDQWKRWPNVKDWENGRNRESVWPDGRVRGG